MLMPSPASTAFEAANTDRAKLAFLYEHPQWFANVFAELERRKFPFDRIFIPDHFYDMARAFFIRWPISNTWLCRECG
jgi:hypothetical protein